MLKKIITLTVSVFLWGAFYQGFSCCIAQESTQTVKKTSKKGTSKKTKTAKSPKKAKVKAVPKSDEAAYQPKVRAVEKKKPEEEIITTVGGKTRVDFEDLLIEGQTKKADTVYLFERTESKINSLVKIRKDFRKEIMDSYLNQ